MGITLFIIVTLIFGTYILSNVDGKKAGYAILATAAMAFILLGISLITKDILIPIGKMWDDALIGAGVVLGIIAIFGAVLFLIGKFADKFAVELAIGAIIMTAVAVVMLATGTACLLFAYEAKKINELNKGGAVFLGAATMIGLFAIMGTVFTAIGALTPLLPLIIAGGAVLTVIGGIMTVVSGVMVLFMKALSLVMVMNE